MTDKEQRFCAEYLVDLNGAQAAIRAGYSARSAAVTASRLLTKATIVKELTVRKAAQLQKADLSATRVLEELRRLAFADVRQLFDVDGHLRPLQDLTDEQAAAIASIEVLTKNVSGADGHTDTIHKIKCWDKTKSLELLAKHFALLTERVEHGGTITLAALLGVVPAIRVESAKSGHIMPGAQRMDQESGR